MGYAHYVLGDGREAGYGVADVCNVDGCDEKIDRGLAYLCGDVGDGGEHGCGRYFCYTHLFYALRHDEADAAQPPQLCPGCLEKWTQAGHPDEDVS